MLLRNHMVAPGTQHADIQTLPDNRFPCNGESIIRKMLSIKDLRARENLTANIDLLYL